MMPRHRVQTLFTWLMAALCVLLGWIILGEVAALPSTQAAAPAVAPAVDPVAPALPARASVALPDRGALAVIVERPVFAESRRADAPRQGPAPALDFTLVGVVISDRERSAIVQPPRGAIQRVAEGEEVGGWTVVGIAPDHIVVRRDATEAQMPLDYGAPAPPAANTSVAKTSASNGGNAIATKATDAEPPDIEAQAVLPDQPPEVLPSADNDRADGGDDDGEQQ
jgi:type II secretory pathway component PulC